MRSYDWSSHPLGDPGMWPQSLKSAVSICLGSRFPILLWWGPELFMLYNDGYRTMLGRKHPASLGQRGRECWQEIWDIIGPMLEETVLRQGDATWSNDQLLLVTRNGYVEESYFTYTYSPIRDESGGVGGVFCAVIETTERVIAERRLAFLKALAEITSNALDARAVSARAISALKNALPDVPFAGLYLADDAANRMVASTASCPEAIPLDLPLIAPEAIALEQPHRIVPIVMPGQTQPVGVLLAGVSAQRPLDDSYLEFLALIARQIGNALADARAHEAERARAEALAELDRAKTAFFSNVSHEFRTPLTLMLGPLDQALASPERALVDPALGAVQRNAQRLLKLVNALLDVARIEAGRADATFEPVDLDSLTREMAAAFRYAVEAAGLSFEIDCDPLPEPAYVDPGMWEKIIFNLLSNALKFTFAGGIRVSVGADGAYAKVAVSDTGVGIPDDQLASVFQRFHRIKGTQSRTHEGAGIGLALVQELVRLHGGTITVTSTVGEGTTFTILLPLGAAHLPSSAIGSPRPLPQSRLTASSYVAEALGWSVPGDTLEEGPEITGDSTPRILLADDNRDMREYLARLLGARWKVRAVGDGRAALDALRAERPDLVVADVMMPGMDGFELLAEIRREPELAALPVMLVSARAGEEATLRAIEAGADDYVVKPFTARDLLARVDAQLTRAQVRAAVRERMTQIEALLDHAPLGVYLVNQQMELTFVNSLARPVFGDIPDLIGRSFSEILHRLWTPAYANEVMALFRRVLETGEPYSAPERPEVRADRGTVEYYEWQIVRLVLPDGSYGIVCYFHDVSQQVRTRLQIAASEERFRALVTATSDAVYRVNPDWTEAKSLDDRENDEESGHASRSWIEHYIPESDRRAVSTAIDDAIRTKSTFELEHRVLRANGAVGWALSRAVPICDAAGTIVEWFGTTRDITARREAEEFVLRLTAESEQQRRLYRTILASTPDLVYVFDRNHRFTYANESLLQMWGKTWDEAIGRTCLELGYPDWHAAMHDREIDQVIATRQPIRGEVPFTGTTGPRFYDYIFVPVIGINGDVEAIAGTTRDVTERKLAEDVVRRSEQRLADANRAKDEFLATLSHELRTPLNAVLGWANMLRTGSLRPEQRTRALESLERNARAQAQLVDDLLDMSRIVSGKLALKTAPVDLASVTASAVDAVKPAADAKRLALRVHAAPDADLHVSGDADRLQQVVWNLLSNAVKFTPEDGLVDVALAVDGSQVVLTVTDNGEGIDSEFLPHVFERFQQADSAPSRRHGGVGLGLAIVRHLTEAHGGTVSAHSEGLGRGATFTVRLPLHTADTRHADSDGAATARAAMQAPQGFRPSS